MVPPALDIPGLLVRFAAGGDRPALSFYRGKDLAGRLTCVDLVARVELLAGALSERHGVRAGDRVAILAPNRLEIPVLVLALLRLGAVVVPLNPGAAPEDWAYVLEHSGATGVAVSAELRDRLPPAAGGRFLLPVEEALGLGGVAPPVPEGLAEAMGIVLYTSGTTGAPKGVALRQSSLVWNGWSMARNFGLDGTAQYAVLPLYHAHAFGFGLMTALTTGGHLVFSERLEPFTWARVVQAEAVEVSSVVPALVPQLLAAGVSRAQVPTLRHLMVSSAPLPVDLARQFETRTGIPLIQGWGLSEYTNFACCLSPFDSADEHRRLMFDFDVPSVGPALEGTEVRVLDPDGGEAGEGVRGEMAVRGHSTMLGYFRDPEATARTIDGDGWLRTGDEGFFRLHGRRRIHFITGRIKEIIIRDAEKFSPLWLERRLVELLPELSGKLVVVGFAHREHGEEVGAYLELERCDEPLRGRLLAALGQLTQPERPKVVLYGVRPVPRTHTGKIQRRKMQPWFETWSNHRGQSVIAPLGPV